MTPAPRILCVDDDRDTVESLAILLDTRGYRAFVATTGQEALKLASRLRPRAIVLDVGLPDIDGIEVCRRIRTEPWAKATVILALTGWTDQRLADASALAGFDHYLLKPTSVDSLTTLLRFHLSQCA